MTLLGIFIFLVFLLAYFRKKTDRHEKDADEQFWARENRANTIRRQDISGLPYINISLDKLPIGICKNEEVQDCENTLHKLLGCQILNLGTQTNTELKLKYGPANLSFLSECDQRFVTLCHTLLSYGNYLIKSGYETEGIQVLEYGISCGSDLSKNYLILADYYHSHSRTADLESLLANAKQLDSLMKDSIIRQLEEKMHP